MESGQNSNRETSLKIILASMIAISEITIIVISHDSEIWKQINTVLMLVFLNIAFVSFGIWRRKTRKELIDSRKKEIHERERILTIINSLPDGILSVSPKGEIELFNSAVMSLLDTNKNLLGQNINKILTLKNLSGDKFNFREVFRKGAPFFSANDLIFEQNGDKLRIEIEILSIRGFYTGEQKTQKSFAVILRNITK